MVIEPVYEFSVYHDTLDQYIRKVGGSVEKEPQTDLICFVRKGMNLNDMLMYVAYAIQFEGEV